MPVSVALIAKRCWRRALSEALAPVHERMDYYLNHLDEIHLIITEGNAGRQKSLVRRWKKFVKLLKFKDTYE